jgi:hypothetical protein
MSAHGRRINIPRCGRWLRGCRSCRCPSCCLLPWQEQAVHTPLPSPLPLPFTACAFQCPTHNMAASREKSNPIKTTSLAGTCVGGRGAREARGAAYEEPSWSWECRPPCGTERSWSQTTFRSGHPKSACAPAFTTTSLSCHSLTGSSRSCMARNKGKDEAVRRHASKRCVRRACNGRQVRDARCKMRWCKRASYSQDEDVAVALEKVVEHALGLAVERSRKVRGILLREGLAACERIPIIMCIM